MGVKRITVILENRTAQIILTGIVVGKLIEFSCSHFIKKNPEMFKDYIDKHPELSPKPTKTTERENKKENDITRIRGGSFQVKKIVIETLKSIIILGKENGFNAIVTYSVAKAGKLINEKAVLRLTARSINGIISGMVQAQPSMIAAILEGKEFKNYKVPSITLYDLYSNVCNDAFRSLFHFILKNTEISYEKKSSESVLALKGTLDGVLGSKDKNNLARCIVTILQQLAGEESTTGYIAFLEMFTAALEAGAIPHDMGVFVVKKLRESDIPISSALEILINNRNKSNLQAIDHIPRGGSSQLLITIIQKKRFDIIRKKLKIREKWKKLKSRKVGAWVSDKGSVMAGLGVEILLLLSSNGKIDSYLESKKASVPNVERQVYGNNPSILDSKLQSEDNSEKISKSEKARKKGIISQAEIDKEMQNQELGKELEKEEKPTPVKPKASRKRRVKHTRAKMVTLQDLKPLEDFPDVVEPNNRNQRSIQEGRIRNK